jgi:spoIIIJ-associated protein
LTAEGAPPDASAGDRVGELVEKTVAALQLDGRVEVEETEEVVRATVEGDDVGLLIGHHGQTIDALQHLALRVAQRDAEFRKRVVVDAAGYRARREDALQREADRAASDAVRFDRPVSLDAMVASERRFVHEYLRDRGDVDTYSEGDEPDRHLVVAPLRA